VTVPSDDEVLFLALGDAGEGEIGMNLNLYGHAGKWLMVDLFFPASRLATIDAGVEVPISPIPP